MSYYVKERISKQEAMDLPVGSTYFKVYLLDEDGIGKIDIVGRYTTMFKAQSACRSFALEELDGECGTFAIYIYQNNEKGNSVVIGKEIYYNA